jgi:hypothetical protein
MGASRTLRATTSSAPSVLPTRTTTRELSFGVERRRVERAVVEPWARERKASRELDHVAARAGRGGEA